MSNKTYVIRYYGELNPGITIDQTRASFGQVFHAEASVIDAIFSHSRVVLARDLTEEQADALVERLNGIGMVVKKESAASLAGDDAPQAQPAVAPAAPVPQVPTPDTGGGKGAEARRPMWEVETFDRTPAPATAAADPEPEPAPQPAPEPAPEPEPAPQASSMYSSFPEIINGSTRLTIPPDPPSAKERAKGVGTPW
ncbi:MAG: hypothetical protein LBT74_04965 [Acidobacteriota bacterium]|nr:hypothetical protein [Acidobacteriota bacterium]